MRLIKLAFLSLVVLFGVVTLISLLIPSHIRISKAVNLPDQSSRILPLVANQQQWSRWHPAFATEEGEQRMRPVRFQRSHFSDSLVVWQMYLPNKRPIANGFQFYRFSPSDSLTLQWYMDFDLPWYPWQKFGSLFYEGTYGVMMEQGLQNIKAQVR